MLIITSIIHWVKFNPVVVIIQKNVFFPKILYNLKNCICVLKKSKYEKKIYEKNLTHDRVPYILSYINVKQIIME